jgi:hypothetical protein
MRKRRNKIKKKKVYCHRKRGARYKENGREKWSKFRECLKYMLIYNL